MCVCVCVCVCVVYTLYTYTCIEYEAARFELWELLTCIWFWPRSKLYDIRPSLCVRGSSNRMQFAVLYGLGRLHIYRKCND